MQALPEYPHSTLLTSLSHSDIQAVSQNSSILQHSVECCLTEEIPYPSLTAPCQFISFLPSSKLANLHQCTSHDPASLQLKHPHLSPPPARNNNLQSLPPITPSFRSTKRASRLFSRLRVLRFIVTYRVCR